MKEQEQEGTPMDKEQPHVPLLGELMAEEHRLVLKMIEADAAGWDDEDVEALKEQYQVVCFNIAATKQRTNGRSGLELILHRVTEEERGQLLGNCEACIARDYTGPIDNYFCPLCAMPDRVSDFANAQGVIDWPRPTGTEQAPG